jgi:outer membrane lipoprotein-sorting protein
MAGAIIIACGIGILLLVLVGYVLVGSILASGDSIASAQKDMTALKENQLNTNIDIVFAQKNYDNTFKDTHVTYYDPTDLYFDVKNTGNEIIDYNKLGVVVYSTGTNSPIYFNQGDGTGKTWVVWYDICRDDTYHVEVSNPGQWDPGEYIYCRINSTPYVPSVIYVFTGNGVTDSRTVV